MIYYTFFMHVVCMENKLKFGFEESLEKFGKNIQHLRHDNYSKILLTVRILGNVYLIYFLFLYFIILLYSVWIVCIFKRKNVASFVPYSSLGGGTKKISV